MEQNKNFVKRIQQIIVCIILIAQFSCAQSPRITEENYRKIDKEIWGEYEEETNKIMECYAAHPEKEDSLKDASDRIYAITIKKSIAASIQYASVPSALEQLFRLRLNVPKDTLSLVFKSLPDSMQTSAYGRSLLYHIESEQISEGSRYYDFKAIDDKGRDFALSSLEGKNILLIYDGLGCMGQEGRDYLDKIYRETTRDNFELVVYCLSSDLEDLQQLRAMLSSDYLLVSDFLVDHTPVKIIYGTQSTPTCFFINREGIVVMKTVGLSQTRVTQLLEEQR